MKLLKKQQQQQQQQQRILVLQVLRWRNQGQFCYEVHDHPICRVFTLLFILDAAVTSIKGIFYQMHGHADTSKLTYTGNINNEFSTEDLMKHLLRIQLYPVLIMLLALKV